jgi:hypothetical protein
MAATRLPRVGSVPSNDNQTYAQVSITIRLQTTSFALHSITTFTTFIAVFLCYLTHGYRCMHDFITPKSVYAKSGSAALLLLLASSNPQNKSEYVH